MDTSPDRSPDNKKEDSPRLFESRELFGGSKIIVIRHREQLYRLMITRQDKLILNK